MYIYVYNWITLLYSRNYHNIVNQLYLNKIKFFKCLAKEFWFYSVEHGNALKTFEHGNDNIRTQHVTDIAKSDLEGGGCGDRNWGGGPKNSSIKSSWGLT